MNAVEHRYLLIVETSNGTQVHRVTGIDLAYASLNAQPILRSIGVSTISSAYLVPQSMCTVLGLPLDDGGRRA